MGNGSINAKKDLVEEKQMNKQRAGGIKLLNFSAVTPNLFDCSRTPNIKFPIEGAVYLRTGLQTPRRCISMQYISSLHCQVWLVFEVGLPTSSTSKEPAASITVNKKNDPNTLP